MPPCSKGPDCPFQHEQQHTSEFSHDGQRPSHWDQLGPGQHLSGPRTDKRLPAPLTERNSEVGSSPSTSDVDQYCVHQIQGLGSAENDKVVKLLEKVAWQVRPIMIKYKWRVGLLLELKPEDMSRGGDNMNRGQRVRLKVRQPGGGFYDFDHVLLVMLHELCHNRHGKHDHDFYTLLDKITLECEELIRKGVGGTGAGFDAPGTKLATDRLNARDMAQAKAQAAQAAEKRARQQAMMGGGRLGGSEELAKLPPREAAAAAAERRAQAASFAKRHLLLDDVSEESAPDLVGAGGPSVHRDVPVVAPARASPPTGVSDDEMGEAVAQLKAMGFAEAEAREVLPLVYWDVDAAVDILTR